MEECGHGRWLEGDSYKLDYFLGKNQKKKREREKKKTKTWRKMHTNSEMLTGHFWSYSTG